MKVGITAVILIALIVFALRDQIDPVVAPQTTFNESSIITAKALSSYKENYLQERSHKAFAQAESGAWAWRADRTSAEHASRSAMIACMNNNAKNQDKYPCVVINVNDQWLNRQ